MFIQGCLWMKSKVILKLKQYNFHLKYNQKNFIFQQYEIPCSEKNMPRVGLNPYQDIPPCFDPNTLPLYYESSWMEDDTIFSAAQVLPTARAVLAKIITLMTQQNFNQYTTLI